ncbi:MAG: hypothetical protein GF317_10320 [Candidatus Lokiarchaeota archaeon]|nr:hypothetical protein [Candidatus Lokiarchaeota archaeon]MBD3200048.1 hypothetical protein [Candidatus Lokiarchaeota archaeon]
MEIKSTTDNRDVFDLIKKGELYKKIFKKDYDGPIIACLEINQTNFEHAINQNVHVIAEKIV